MKVEDRRSVELRERARGLERRRIGTIVTAVVGLLLVALSAVQATLLTRPAEYGQRIAQIDGLLQTLDSISIRTSSEGQSIRENYARARTAWMDAIAAYPWYLAGWIGSAAIWGGLSALCVVSEREVARKQRRYPKLNTYGDFSLFLRAAAALAGSWGPICRVCVDVVKTLPLEIE
ncbi:MAG: hypothetical protein IT450_06365, partial [Phycisphaerales bacterium]|nr:hypothetical protein [Phycisphaerales bacterium]